MAADPGPPVEGARELARALGVSLTLADVLARRGRSADEPTRRFLEPRLAHLTAPDAMADRDAAASHRGDRSATS